MFWSTVYIPNCDPAVDHMMLTAGPTMANETLQLGTDYYLVVKYKLVSL